MKLASFTIQRSHDGVDFTLFVDNTHAEAQLTVLIRGKVMSVGRFPAYDMDTPQKADAYFDDVMPVIRSGRSIGKRTRIEHLVAMNKIAEAGDAFIPQAA